MRLAAALLIVACVGTQGCVRDRHSFATSTVHAAVPELRRNGSASMRNEAAATVRLTVDEPVTLLDASSWEGDETMPLGELIGRCTDPASDREREPTLGPEDPRCPLLRDGFVGYERLDVTGSALAITGIALATAAVTGAIGCGLFCDEPWNAVSAAALGAAAIGIVVAIVIVVSDRGYPVPH